MNRLWLLIKLLGILLCGFSTAYATNSALYYHNYWLPKFDHQALSYCLSDLKTCGKLVADRYCHSLGYKNSVKSTIAHNIGKANFLDKKSYCLGWKCAGFKVIRCEGAAIHQPPRNYYYRFKKFVVPRWQHYRVDWCYQPAKDCGKRAASAFCRRMGYETASGFLAEDHLAATKTLGNQQLCFKNCKGFSSIVCYR